MNRISYTAPLKRFGSALRRIARRFRRADEGAAAIEFALVAAPFIALLFAVLETALVFFAGQTLEAAVAESARLIMTGQAQTQGLTQAGFKNQVCNRIFGLFDCANKLYVDVETYSNFASVNNSPPLQNGSLDTSKMGYVPGGPGDIVVVTLYYQWPIAVSLLGNNLSNVAGSQRLLVATSTFRNEPYQ